MKKIKITQVKSSIDRPERQKLTLRALGLNKMNASREVEATDQILGMVRTVNHLIKIEESSTQPTIMQEPVAAISQTPEPIHFTNLPQAEIPQPASTQEDVLVSDAADKPVAMVANSEEPAESNNNVSEDTQANAAEEDAKA